jgi:hypothetical protein
LAVHEQDILKEEDIFCANSGCFLPLSAGHEVRFAFMLSNLKDDAGALVREKYFMYEPLLKMCEKYMVNPDKLKKK